ncbi:MAG: hypothetical protein Q9213_005282 [Squamulea squamosa]
MRFPKRAVLAVSITRMPGVQYINSKSLNISLRLQYVRDNRYHVMQYSFAILVICTTLAAASLTPSDASLSTPPPPAIGQSVSQWIDQIFEDLDETSTTATDQTAATAKRGYSASNGIHTSTWTNDTEKISYNITVDLSHGCSGLNYTTDVGVYTFTNGTTTNETMLVDMVKDLWSLHRAHRRVQDYAANHTAVIAQLALDEANQLLSSGLICGRNQTTGPITDLAVANQHNELRHLLQNRWSYWAAVFLAAPIGALAGAGIAAISDLVFKGDVNAENVVQTAVVIGVATIIGGILSRMHEIGRLDRAENVANRVQRANVRAGEVVAHNVAMGWGRRMIQRVIRRNVEEAISDIMSSANPGSIPDPGTPLDPNTPLGTPRDPNTPLNPGTPLDPGSPLDPNVGTPGSTQRGTTTPGTGTSRSLNVCLKEEDATAAALALGDMSSREFELRTEAEVARVMAERGEGDCNV